MKLNSVRLIIVSILICITSSCGNTGNSKFVSVQALSVDDTLYVSQIISLEERSELLNPLRILNIDDQYLLISERAPNNFFEVYSLPEVAHLYSWGSQGRGPDEFMAPPVYINVTDRKIIPFKPFQQQLVHYKVTDSTLLKTQIQKLSYEGQRDALNRIKRLNDSLYVAMYGAYEETDHEFIALQPDNEQPLFTFGNYPDDEMDQTEKYFKYSKSHAAKPDGSRFAAFYYNYNMFSIYNSEGDLIKQVTISGGNKGRPASNENYKYRQAAWASDDYIYLLGLYGDDEEIFSDPDYDSLTSLEVWDWNGDPVYRASFDRVIHNFTVSENYGKIYGYSVFSPKEIYEYKLPEEF